MGACETGVRISCRASLLKSDGVRLKGMTKSFRWCARCGLSERENAKHVLIQCPAYQDIRSEMFAWIQQVEENTVVSMLDLESDLLSNILGKMGSK